MVELRVRRLVLAVAAVLLASVPAAPPAAAHTVEGSGSTNFLTELTSVPEIPGVTVRILEFGARLQVENRSDTELTVLGYQGEPYLRIGPDGVFWNLRSPATYVNQSVKTDPEIPSTVDAEAPPEWEKISDGSSASWHDHRIHWMGAADPPEVARDPDSEHVILPDWKVPLEYDGRSVTVEGTLTWVPGPNPLPWVLLAVVVAAAAVALARWWGRGTTAVQYLTGVVIVVGVWQAAAIASGGATTLRDAVFRFAIGSVLLAGGWIIGGYGIRRLRRGRSDGLYLAFVPGFVTLGIGGIGDLDVLSRSQVTFEGGPTLARLAVALVIGASTGLLIATFLTLQREIGGFAPWITFRSPAVDRGPDQG